MRTFVHQFYCMARVLISAVFVIGLLLIWPTIIGSVEVYAEDQKTKRPSPSSSNPPIRVLPFGDSITQGGRRDRPEFTYRYPLYYLARDAGIGIDYIGSHRRGLHADAVWPDKNDVPFDLDHEGHYGWTASQLSRKLPEWLPRYAGPPDIALVHVGSNDYEADSYDEAVLKPLKDIVSQLRKVNPNVIVLVGHVFESGWRAWWMRLRVEATVRSVTTKASPVETVDHHHGWIERPDVPGSHTFDYAHPNLKGQLKMAHKWFDAMLPHLRRLSVEKSG
ncbi:MAG: GDSL-type esterase/lipase family protein [Pseudomonadota bacterium]